MRQHGVVIRLTARHDRDGSFCEGYDPRLRLERKQTIMEGHKCCTFRYSLEE